MSYITSSLLISVLAIASELPSWIASGATEDSSSYFVLCSAEGLDPEQTRIEAESKCLARAAKLGGVVVTVKSKTVQSLSGTDVSESAEVVPFKKSIVCEPTNQLVEKLNTGFRVWLQCRVKKADVQKIKNSPMDLKSEEPSKDSYKRAQLTIVTTPKAEKIIVRGTNGERVIDPVSNSTSAILKEGDTSIVVKRLGYKDKEILLPNWSNGESLLKSVTLDKEY